MIKIQQPLGSKKRNQFGISKKKKKKKTAITRFDTPNTAIFHSAATYKDAPGVTF